MADLNERNLELQKKLLDFQRIDEHYVTLQDEQKESKIKITELYNIINEAKLIEKEHSKKENKLTDRINDLNIQL